jgi:hypothetical protein
MSTDSAATPPRKAGTTEQEAGLLVRCGLALANWSERWFPDPLVFALVGIGVVFLFGLLLRESPAKLAIQGGKNFWALVPFTMQMVMIIIGGYVVASTPLVYRAIRWLAGIPRSPRGAIAIVALFSMLTSLISWGLSLIFSGLYVRELTQRVKGMDYRAAGAAAYLGLGAVWAMGVSSSAAMLMATKGAIPPSLFSISGLIPLTQTIFLWQSIATTAVLIVVSVLVAYLSAPSAENARTAEHYGIRHEPITVPLEPKTKPGEWLEYSPLLNILVAALLCWYLVDVFRSSPQGALAALDLNTYNLTFITAGLLLHWRPKRFVKAVADCIPATGRADPVPVLRRHLRDDRGKRHFQRVGEIVRRHHHSRHLSAAGGGLFGSPGRVYPLGRQQVGDRGAVRARSGQTAPSASGLGGPDLQCLGSPAQPHQPLLDAAAAWHLAAEGERLGRIRSSPVDHSHSDRVLFLLVICAVRDLHTCGAVNCARRRRNHRDASAPLGTEAEVERSQQWTRARLPPWILRCCGNPLRSVSLPPT